MSKFGELEATVMDRLWNANGARSVRDLMEDLQLERTIAYTTVMTVMERLFRKGSGPRAFASEQNRLGCWRISSQPRLRRGEKLGVFLQCAAILCRWVRRHEVWCRQGFLQGLRLVSRLLRQVRIVQVFRCPRGRFAARRLFRERLQSAPPQL